MPTPAVYGRHFTKSSPSHAPGEAKTTYVRKRLEQTLAVVSREALAACEGITLETIDYVETTDSSTLPYATTGPLDIAWAIYVKGKNPTAPGVPHGSPSTYRDQCCRCQPCTVASVNKERKRVAGIKQPMSPADPRLAERVCRHLARLRQHATIRQIARAGKMDKATIQRIAAGPVDSTNVSLRTAAKILALTVEQFASTPVHPRLMTDVKPTRHLIGTMRALGYPITWQEREAGLPVNTLHRCLNHHEQVSVRYARAIDALARRLGDRQAGPEHGIETHMAERMRREARAQGWYPPAAYDDDGNLDVRSVPGHKWAAADEWCASQVVAHYLLSTGLSARRAAKEAGITYDGLAARPRHGLTYDEEGNLDYKASRDRIKQFADTYGRYENYQIGAVTAAIELGVIRGDFRTYWADHPEVVTWVAAEQAAADTETVPVTHSEAA